MNYSAFSKTFSYTYYPNGLKKTFTMPGGTTYEYIYDNNDRLTHLTIPGVGDIEYPSYTMNRPDSVNFPGGSQQSYQYDDLLRIERIVSSASGMDYQYTSYDNMSNILTKSTEHGNYVYDYDDVYRLMTADNPTLDDEAYTYDGVGNRETASGVSGSITHNANNELTIYGDIFYDYDANGNMIRKSVDSVAVISTYNVANRLIQVEDDATATVIAEYGYDPFGRRLWKEVDGTRTYFFYADEGLVAEYDATGNEIRSYGYQPDSTWTTDPLFLREGSEYYWYQNDHLGTPQKLVDGTGTVVWSATYTAFGEAQIDVEAVTNNLRFSGQYFDEETRLHYNYHRYYAPGIGRYLRIDPIGFAARDVNLYRYVFNNPVNWVDPSGLYRSHWLLRALVPGQVLWDRAITAIENGDPLGAGLNVMAMLAEQTLVVLTVGELSALLQAGTLTIPEAVDFVDSVCDPLPELIIDYNNYPDLADNIWHAQQAGHPDILTYGGSDIIDSNRSAALNNPPVPNIRNFSRDEYPFASTLEGGQGAWVGHIPGGQQSAQGGLLKNLYDKLQIGDQFRVVVINHPNQ